MNESKQFQRISANEYHPPAYTFEEDQTFQKAPTKDEKLNRLKQIAAKYELAGGAVAKLRQLESYDIVVIADDSSSMMNPAHDVSKDDPFAKIPTRWEELRERITEIVDIATCLDPDGIDIYFLNGKTAENVMNPEIVKSLFAITPHGYTPLSKVYRQVLDDKVRGGERPVLIIVATDGEPNKEGKNGAWSSDLDGFKNLLMTRDGLRSEKCPTCIMACTDSDYEIGWMNELDDKVPNIDVIDDYQAERQEVLGCQGQSFHFSKGDYIVKTLVGPIDPIYDTLDEKKLNKWQLAEYLGQPAPPPDTCPCVLL